MNQIRPNKEDDLGAIVDALYGGPSKVVHSRRNTRRLDEYVKRVAAQQTTHNEPTSRDLSLLPLLVENANEDGRFDPVGMNLDLGAVKRSKSFGFLEIHNGHLRITEKARRRAELLYPEKPITNPVEKEELARTFQVIERRRNQGPFRRALLEIFQYKCAITGCEAVDVLEAAHIVPYAEGNPDRDSVENGILLRSDLHILFDLHLITIHWPSKMILVSDKLKYFVPYKDFTAKIARIGRASEGNLRQHFERTRAAWQR